MENIIDALLAEAASLKASAETRRMGHTSYVTKAQLRRGIADLRAQRALVIRANDFNGLPADVEGQITATIVAAETAI